MSAKTASTAADLSRPMRLLCVGLLVLLGFSLGCSEFIVIGIEGNIADAFSVSLAQAGELISSFAITYAVLTPVLAIATGRFRRFQLLVAYAAVFCAANLVQAMAPTFAVLLLSRVLIGAVSGAFLAVGVTYIPELLGPERMSMGISVVYAAFSVAMDEPATMAEQAGLLAEPQIVTGILIFVFGVGSVYVFYGYVTPYLEQVLGLSPMGASAALMGYGVVCFFSNLLSGWVDARFGMRSLVVTFPILAALLFGLWALGPVMPAALVVVMGIALLMYVASVPCISAFMETARRSHPKALTLASSLEPMSFNIGIAFGTAVGGAVVSGPGIASVGLVGGAFALVALALRRHR